MMKSRIGKVMRETSTKLKRPGVTMIVVAIGLLFAVFGSSEATAGDTLERIKSAGSVSIAIGNEPPYAALDESGNVEGVLVDIIQASFASIGVNDVEPVVVDWGAMIPGLQANRYDMIAAGLYINPKRCKAIAFSEPDICGAAGLLVAKGNPHGLSSVADVAANTDVKVSSCPGCGEYDVMTEAGVDPSRIVNNPNLIDAFSLISTGRVDAEMGQLASLRAIMSKVPNADDFEIVGPLPDAGIECSGMGFRMADNDLRDAYNAGLKKIQESGEFDRILASYEFLPELTYQTSSKKLCGM
jgi:polar amino acid transport system substrate-binding protein